jgi:anti-sigma factor (TIGR02949 family)
LNCQDVIQELSNFMDGELDVTSKQELESHLNECTECKLVVDQTKKTVRLFCDSEPVELPGEVRSRLHDALRRKFKEAAH